MTPCIEVVLMTLAALRVSRYKYHGSYPNFCCQWNVWQLHHMRQGLDHCIVAYFCPCNCQLCPFPNMTHPVHILNLLSRHVLYASLILASILMLQSSWLLAILHLFPGFHTTCLAMIPNLDYQ